MKVIFLDIDGVLCTRETDNRRKKEYMKYGKYISPVVDIERLLLLKQIVDSTSAKIVITSTWRTQILDKFSKGKELINLFSEYGLEIYDLTDFDENRNRINEINCYLEEHEIEEYIIMDDECNLLAKYFDDHVVHIQSNYPSYVKNEIGLLECHVKEATNKLNKDKRLELV